MVPIKILFDATVLFSGRNKSPDRTGIYWVAKNILDQFLLNDNYQVTLYSTKFTIRRLPYILPIIIDYNEQKYKYNINVHKEQMKEENIFLIIFRYLQIIKNLIYILIIKSLKIISRVYNINNYDAFISPVYSIPDFVSSNKTIKIFHILHDCIPVLENIPSVKIDNCYWFLELQKNLNNNTYYFCVSENTKNDFLRIASDKLNKEKMHVTPIAPSKLLIPNYKKDQLKNVLKKYGYTYNENNNYLLSLCTIDPRKNISFTVKCFFEFIKKNNINNMIYFLAGGYFENYYKIFLSETTNYDESKNKVIYLGYIDDEDINILYSNSLFFIYLSQYEGFGLPPLEAMQAGTPVICSNNSSLPEVVGDAAIKIPHDNEKLCIEAMEKLYFNEKLRKEYISKGIERAKLFSWEKTFEKMNKIILNICR